MGAQAVFSCVVQTEDPESVDISWQFNGEALIPDGRVRIFFDSVVINPTEAGDAGTYTCSVEDGNSGEIAMRSASLSFAGLKKK